MRILLLAAAAVTLVAGAANAQMAPGAPPPPPMAHMGGAHGMIAPMHDPSKMADHIRTVLQLRPDQEPALQAFVASMKPAMPMHDGPMGERMKKDHEAMAAKSTPEKLDWMISKAREHIARLEEHAAAVKTFYAALSPSQQKAFDTLAMQHMHMMHGGGMGGRMGPPMGHPGEE